MCSRDRSRQDRHPALVAGVSDAVPENTKGRAAAGNTALKNGCGGTLPPIPHALYMVARMRAPAGLRMRRATQTTSAESVFPSGKSKIRIVGTDSYQPGWTSRKS